MTAPGRTRILLAGLALSVAAVACSSPTETKNVSTDPDDITFDRELLTQHWVHSFEEDGDPIDGMIFRPVDSREFPPSWFRMAYVFHEGGALQWLALAPNDAHFLRPGSWEWDANAAPILRLDMDGPRWLEVLELTDDLLRLRVPPTR